MYCQSCGMALSQQMRYCNRCGTQLVAPAESATKTAREKRLDEYLDGLFWITVFGLAFVFGGTVILKKLALNNWLILGYMVLSSVAFLINFGLSLWGVARIHREGKLKDNDLPLLTGWRYEHAGHRLVNLLEGTPVRVKVARDEFGPVGIELTEER